MLQLAEQKEALDVVFMDPPRTGSDEAFLTSVVTCTPAKIVYISCNPKTMAENLRYLDYYGYKCRYLKPFDNFPMTKHTECIALLEKEY